jgi:exopolysaccharide biosynthesis polyprenyl glycosylphosphotransferase
MNNRSWSANGTKPAIASEEVKSRSKVLPAIDLTTHPLIVAAIDCAIAFATYWLAFSVRSYLPLPLTTDLMPSERFFQVQHFWILIVALQPSLMFVFDTYHEIRRKRLREFIRPVFASSGLQVLILIAVYFFSGNVTFPRTVFPLYWMLNSIGVITCRWLIKPASKQQKRRVLIVGTGEVTQQLLKEVERSADLGLAVVGIVSDKLQKGHTLNHCRVLGDRSCIPALIQEYGVEEVILTPESSWKDSLVESITNLETTSPVRISIVPSVYEILIGRIQHFNFHDIPLIEVVREPNDPVALFAKRVRDIVFSMFGIILLLPVWLVVSVAIKISDGGRIFYVQNRVGQAGKPFRIIKFRTMREGAEHNTGPVLASSNDPRFTLSGRWLRRYRIDETPQLINMLMGQMTLVGPRPDRPEFVAGFMNAIPGYAERQKVKPGITGLAQIRCHYHTDPSIKLKYDLAYIYNYSFLLDLVIMAETLRIVLRRQGV